MKTIVHPLAAQNIPEASVILNKAYPLLRELVHQYGVQVIGSKPHYKDNTLDKLLLAWNEIPVAAIGYTPETNQYFIRNVMQPKERGRTHEDRYTFSAAKLSSLMRTIKKFKLMPFVPQELLEAQYRSSLDRVPTFVAKTFKGKTKPNRISGEDVHELLNIVFNNRDPHSLSKESIDKYKVLLDIYSGVDKVREQQNDKLNSLFSKPVWAIGHDNTNAMLVGKLQYRFDVDMDHDVTNVRYTIEQPFTRVHDVDHIAELIPRLTMTKVHMQQNHDDIVKSYGFVGESQLVPKRFNGFIPELNVLCATEDTWGTLSEMRWIFVL